MDLPDELWRRVFECQMDSVGPSDYGSRNMSHEPTNQEALIYVQVCKRWKTLAEPFIYRDLFFSDLDALERAAHAVSRREEAEKISRWMHSLTLSPQDLELSALRACAEYAASILCHGRRIVHLKTGSMPLTNPICAILAMVAVESLSSWELTFGPDAWVALARIGTLVNLRSLTLTTYLDVNDQNRWSWASMPLADADGWELPALQSLFLSLSSLKSPDHMNIFAFLGKCRLPLLQKCRILAHSLNSPAHALGLVEFLSIHSTLRYFQLFSASVEVSDLVLCTSQCTHLCVEPMPLNVEQATYPSLRILTVHGDVDVLEANSLWSLLSGLAKNRSLHPQLDFVKLDIATPLGIFNVKFNWQAFFHDARLYAFIGQALSYAVTLHERGIELLDSKGYSMTMTKKELKE